MKILLKEHQYNFLLEQIVGLNSFLLMFGMRYNLTGKNIKDLELLIKNSGCKNIQVLDIKGPLGYTLHDKLVISKKLLDSGNLSLVLFVLFHELAHSFQFKKYGDNVMYKIYDENFDLDNAVNFLVNTEITANRFARKKLAQFNSKNKIASFEGLNPHIDKNQLKHQIISFRNYIKENNIKNDKKISEMVYNYIKMLTAY